MRSVLDVLKTIRRKPGFWIGTALILGLGVGVNTAVFSTVDTVLYRDLPYREPDRLVMLRQFSASAATPSYAVSKAVVNALATRHDSPFERVAAISMDQSLIELGLSEPEPHSSRFRSRPTFWQSLASRRCTAEASRTPIEHCEARRRPWLHTRHGFGGSAGIRAHWGR